MIIRFISYVNYNNHFASFACIFLYSLRLLYFFNAKAAKIPQRNAEIKTRLL